MAGKSYCVKCQDYTENGKVLKRIKLKNGKTMIITKCKRCKNKKSTIKAR